MVDFPIRKWDFWVCGWSGAFWGALERKKKRKPNVFIATPEKKYAQWAFSFSKKKETLTLCHVF